MPIEIPPPFEPGIPSPNIPSIPATMRDIEGAVLYKSRIQTGHTTGATTAADMARAELYMFDVLRSNRREDDRGIMKTLESLSEIVTNIGNDLTALKDNLTTVKNDVATIKNELSEVKAMVINSEIMSARVYNWACDDGTYRPYAIVRRPDGQLPDAELPALTSAKAIKDATVKELKQYCTDYGLVMATNSRREALCAAIANYVGCMRM